MTTYTLNYVDTCNSQYFGGHHLPVVQVLVDGNSTYKDVKNNLLEYQTYEHLFEDQRFVTDTDLDGFDGDIYKTAVIKTFSACKLEPLWEVGLDIPTEDEEDAYDCYAFFTVRVEEDE